MKIHAGDFDLPINSVLAFVLCLYNEVCLFCQQKYIISGWIIAIGCMIITGISAHPFQQKSYQYSAVDAAFYSALTRPLWSLAIAWIIFSCASGFGGKSSNVLFNFNMTTMVVSNSMDHILMCFRIWR